MRARSLYRWFRATADRVPAAPALTFLDARDGAATTYTYAALYERVATLGDRLAGRGIGAAAPFGVLLRSQEQQVLHYLAALHAGLVPAILTPPNRKLHPEYYQRTMAAVLRRCAFGAVVTDVPGLEIPMPSLAPLTFDDARGMPAPPSTAAAGPPLDASFLQFSSGTTGMKRGVLVSDEAVAAQLTTYADAIGLTPDDRILSWLPLYHDMGFIACLNMPLAMGVHSIMLDPVDWVTRPAAYLQAVAVHRATLSWHPNFAYAFMAQRVRDADIAGVDLSSLRGLFNCSEPVTHESQQAFADRFAPYGLAPDVFKGCYAMAETTFALTHGDADAPEYLDPIGPVDGTRSPSPSGYVSVGRALPGVELRIVDPATGTPLPERHVGEIWVRSPFNFDGYFNDAEATAQALVDGWYRTGDLGYSVGGSLYVAGRLKDVLIVGGVNVFPQDIEELAGRVDGVHRGRVSAFSVFDPTVQTERVVILAEADGDEAEGRRIIQGIRQRVLAAFQISNFEVHVLAPGWLIKSSSGKMARGANRQKWLAADGPAAVAPATGLPSAPSVAQRV